MFFLRPVAADMAEKWPKPAGFRLKTAISHTFPNNHRPSVHLSPPLIIGEWGNGESDNNSLRYSQLLLLWLLRYSTLLARVTIILLHIRSYCYSGHFDTLLCHSHFITLLSRSVTVMNTKGRGFDSCP